MKRRFLFLISIFTRLPGILSAQDWTQLSDLPATERDDGVCFVVGTGAWCGTGLKAGGQVGGDFYHFDLVSETWLAVAALPAGQERQYACAFADAAHGYVLGGVNSSGTLLSDLWIYDPANNTWSSGAAKPGTLLAACSSFVLGDTAYIAGGNNNLGVSGSRELWAYSFSGNSWTRKNDVPFLGRWRASACAQAGKGYLLFGRDENGSFCRELYEYDPVQDSWQQITLFPGAGRNYGAMIPAVSNGLIVFAGIDTAAICYNDLWFYDTGSQQWSQLLSLPSFGRKGGMCFTGAGNLYYTCGIDQAGTRTKETWKYSGLTGLTETIAWSAPVVYPVPAHDRLQLKNVRFPGSFEIFDSMGRSYLCPAKPNDSSVDVSGLEQGFYFLLLHYENERVLTKFVKD